MAKEAETRYIYKVKKQIDGLYQTMGALSGFEPLHLLSLLETMKEFIEALGKSEDLAVHILAYFLRDDSKDA